MTEKRFTTNGKEIIQSNQVWCVANSEHCADVIAEALNILCEKNQRLIKMLDNVANYMQQQHKDMPIDDFVEWWNNIATKGLDGD